MCHMINIFILLTISLSKAEEFLKCSAVGKPNGKCVKDFYPDQEAQESNYLSPYDENYYLDHQEHPSFTQEFSEHSPHYSDQEQFLTGQEYAYGYTVNDVSTGDQKFHRESRLDNVVHGTYSLIEPDGSKRTVVYTADDIHGFKAVVYRDEAHLAHPVHNSELNNNKHAHAEDIPRYNTAPNGYLPTEQPSLNDFINGMNPSFVPQNTGANHQDIPIQATAIPKETTHFHQVTSQELVQSHNSNGHYPSEQIAQNFQILVDNSPTNFGTTGYGAGLQNSNPEILSDIGQLIGEQHFVDSLIKEVDHPETNLADGHSISKEESGRKLIPIASVPQGTPNPILAQLKSEIVDRKGDSHQINQQNVGLPNSIGGKVDAQEVSISPNSIHGLTNIINPTHEPIAVTTNGYTPQNIVTGSPVPSLISSGHLQPTSYTPLDINSRISSQFVDASSVFNTSAVVESPHIVVSTPVPIRTSESPLRLNPLENGEFPLLAHASPSYARRYARQYA